MVEIEIGVLRGQCLVRRIEAQAAAPRNLRLGTAEKLDEALKNREHREDAAVLG